MMKIGAAVTAAGLLVKATLLAAKWAGMARRRALRGVARHSQVDEQVELAFLRDRVAQLELQVSILRKHIGKHAKSPRYTLAERLHVLWFVEYFRVPHRRVTQHFGIARSTLCRWLRRVEGAVPSACPARNRSPVELAGLVWEIARANPLWGRVRVASQLALLGVFVAASTVRNILARPAPDSPGRAVVPPPAEPQPSPEPARPVPAAYPNHVWSVDCTTVLRWGVWPTQILVAIDHFSRKVVAAVALEGPNAGWICNALDAAFTAVGPPRHLISDNHPIFRSDAVEDLLASRRVKHRFGAVGKHGSVAVTERVIRTLKYEWLFRAPVITSFAHLERLCLEFTEWYNGWRPHQSLGGAVPNDLFGRDLPEEVCRKAKVVPAEAEIERHCFVEARVTGFRLRRAA